MSGAHTTQPGVHGAIDGRGVIRVVLVGRTGLDGGLRLDPNVELVRARTSFAAIGEVDAIASDSTRDADGPVVVIIAESARPDGGRDGAKDRAFVRSLRSVGPGVSVLAIGRDAAGVYDGVIGEEEHAGDVRARLHAMFAPPAQDKHAAIPVDAADTGDAAAEAETDGGSAETVGVSPGREMSDDGSIVDDSGIGIDAADGSEIGVEAESASGPGSGSGSGPSLADVGTASDGWMRDKRREAGGGLAGAEAGEVVRGGSAGPRVEETERAMHIGPVERESLGIGARQVEHGAEHGTAQRGPGKVEEGDTRLVEALLAGRGVAGDALGLLRERTGDGSLRYEPDGRAAEGGSPVTHMGRAMGVLHGSSPRGELERMAGWLARWISLEHQHAQLKDAAFRDELTGAWNRRYFKQFMSAVLHEAQTHRREVTILFFDIDDFKKYNDVYGHWAGDEILTETVRLLESVIRPSDRVCRIGGDEFVVIFYEPKGPRSPESKAPESIFEIAKRFQRQICEHRFPKLGDEAPGSLGISGGIASFPWDGRTTEDLLARADELTLASKKQGKNAILLGPGAERVCGVDG